MDARHTTITITTGTILRAMLLAALAWLVYTLRDLVLIVATAVVIASAIEPGVAFLMKRRFSRLFAVVAIYALLVAGFGAVLFFFVPSLVAEFGTFVSSLPVYLESVGTLGLFGQYAGFFGATPSPASADWLLIAREAFNLDVFGNAGAAASRIFGGIFSALLILILSIYFAIVETGVDDFLRVITPARHQRYVLGLWRRSQHKIGLWMQGQLLLAVIIGVLVYLGLMILGVPHALVLAVIAAMFEIIPVFGPTLAAIPAVAVAFAGGGATLGFLTVALYVIAQQFENHLIYPLVVTRVVGVPPLLVILALIAGGQLAGFLGILLSVPVAATIQELVKDLESGRLAEAAAA
mgnify:CR=1 FL=1